MAKYYGVVGYAEHTVTSPGVWEETVTERTYYGDVTRNVRRWDNGEGINDNLNVQNTISIVADAYAYSHFHAIRYVTWMGTRWKVSSVEIERPRLLLTVGGVYSEETEDTPVEEVVTSEIET